jgi:PBSX family phage terminase large subunit
MYNFCPKAQKFITRHPKNDSFLSVLSGAVRSGKTFAMIPKILFGLLNYNIPGDRIIFGVSKETIYKNVLNELFNFVGTDKYKYNRQSGELWICGDLWSVVGAKDEGSEKYIRGRTVGIAYGDELSMIPQSFFEMMLTRLSPEGSRLYGTTNPDSPYHYLYVDYINNDEKKAKPNYIFVEQFSLDDNLSLSEETKERYRTSFKGVFKKRMIDGLWVVAEGAIYKDCYSDELLYDDDSRPIGLLGAGGYQSMYVPIDYGTGNPTVFLWIVDDGNTFWIEDEYYYDSRDTDSTGGVQKTDGQYVKDLIEWMAKRCPGAECIIDPSAASLKAEMALQGVWHSDANNEVLDCIRVVSSLLAQKKIRIHKRCKNHIKELQTYAWNPRQQKLGIDEPMKTHDHSCDALRYFVYSKVPAWRAMVA